MLSTIKHLRSLAKDEHYKRTAVTLFVLSFFCGHVVPTVILVLLLLTPFAPLVVGYLSWVFVFDWKSPTSRFLWPYAARRSDFFRNARVFNYLRDFFPVKLIKTVDLDPERNYVFAYHPHGVFAVGVFTNFTTEATGFSSLFPGLTVWTMTMPVVFSAPIFREALMLLGARSVTTAGCRSLLEAGPGQSIAIVPGGVRDILEACPGGTKIAVRKRKGFVRVAMQTGSPIVPVYGFGENELFDQPKSSLLRNIQHFCTEKFGMCCPFFQGSELAHMLPHRRALNTVVGAPLEIPYVENPSLEEVDKWHGIYLSELTKLFDEHKATYGYSPDKTLEFI